MIFSWTAAVLSAASTHSTALGDTLEMLAGRGAKAHSPYVYNSLIPLQIWDQLNPYFLPEDHPIKARLDRLFKKKRVIRSASSFMQAGFKISEKRRPNNAVIGKHPAFEGYIFKVFLDRQPDICEWSNWVNRIEGAKAIQACIERHGFENFCVPKKWIYPLPMYPSPPENDRIHRKNFILIAEEMDILPLRDNLKAFKEKMRAKILRELMVILTEEGLIDSIYPDNIPFTRNGKLAFIDTEHRYPGRSVKFETLLPFLSDEMQNYWNMLINSSVK